MIKKPDQWERMVAKTLGCHDKATSTHVTVTFDEIAKLLRKEHRAVVRLAKKVQLWQMEQLADADDAFEAFIQELTERAK